MILQSRRFPLLYAGWILVCAILFAALSSVKDSSRPEGRILSIDAAAVALRGARATDPRRFAAYAVVHVARARRNEGGERERWVVLLDRAPRTRLQDAVVVEVAAQDGRVLGMRTPKH